MSIHIVHVPTCPGARVIVAEAGTIVLNQSIWSSHATVILPIPVFVVTTWKLNGAWFSTVVNVIEVGVTVNAAQDSAGTNTSPVHRQRYCAKLRK